MVDILNRRVAAQIEGDFVVFLIGARINRWYKMPMHFWFARTMPRMLQEVQAHAPGNGFLGYEQLTSTINIQYWRSTEDLIRYARDPDQEHYPYWVRFNRELARGGDVGIFHETYKVRAGEYEAIYANMPLFGLGKAAQVADAMGGRATAGGRLGETAGDDAPIAPDGVVRDEG